MRVLVRAMRGLLLRLFDENVGCGGLDEEVEHAYE